MKRLASTAFVLGMACSARAAAPQGNVYSAHLMVDQEVTVSSLHAGIIQTIFVNRGSVVAKDQPLALLDPRELDQEVRQTKEEMELKKIEYERAQALLQGGVSSKSDLDQKKAEYAVAVAQHEKAETERDYAVIRAPFAGVVTEKYARVGQKVIEDQNIPLFKISALEPLLARIYVPEKQLLNLRRGALVEVLPVSFPQARTTGSVEFISPTLDAASGTFQVIVRVKRSPAPAVLRPGLAVEVRLPGGARP